MERVKLKEFGMRRKTLRSCPAIWVVMMAVEATTGAAFWLILFIELRPGYAWCREV